MQCSTPQQSSVSGASFLCRIYGDGVIYTICYVYSFSFGAKILAVPWNCSENAFFSLNERGAPFKLVKWFRTDFVEELLPYASQRCFVGFRRRTKAKKMGSDLLLFVLGKLDIFPYIRRLQGFAGFVSPELAVTHTHVYGGTSTFFVRPYQSFGTMHTRLLIGWGYTKP